VPFPTDSRATLGYIFTITDNGLSQAPVAERRRRAPAWGAGVEMRGFLAEHLGVFDPEDIRILVAAFDKAWDTVQASGVTFDTTAKAEIARAILAKHIIAAAKAGEYDQGRLRDDALVALAQSNLHGGSLRRW
jgi:hypothetical protein